MTNYRDGRDHEYAVIADLERDGYRCTRAAGSKGIADIIALKPGEVLLVQAKRREPRLDPAEREALMKRCRELATPTFRVVPIVVHRPPHKALVYRQLTGTGPADWIPWTADRVIDKEYQ
jgi:Holliday junction resolvase